MESLVPTDVRWVLDFFLYHWNDSTPTIYETLESAGAPEGVLAEVRQIMDEELFA